MDSIVLHGAKKPFGEKLKCIVSGSAPLSEYVQQYVQSAISVKIFQMYGVTEAFGTCTTTDI